MSPKIEMLVVRPPRVVTEAEYEQILSLLDEKLGKDTYTETQTGRPDNPFFITIGEEFIGDLEQAIEVITKVFVQVFGQEAEVKTEPEFSVVDDLK
ncbi:MAG: hypothetical protein PVJ09_03045 [Candidatus Woesebacteria bacterium]|jgi:hypothetical protein